MKRLDKITHYFLSQMILKKVLWKNKGEKISCPFQDLIIFLCTLFLCLKYKATIYVICTEWQDDKEGNIN